MQTLYAKKSRFPIICIPFRYNNPVGVLVLSVLGLIVWILGYRLIKVSYVYVQIYINMYQLKTVIFENSLKERCIYTMYKAMEFYM